jgi:hypothetical protein
MGRSKVTLSVVVAETVITSLVVRRSSWETKKTGRLDIARYFGNPAVSERS